ncbi:hypothetical protein AB0H76_13870 [Nocardia sp. NPDC050712]|uniref:hypothetical protein n=1 Tax=Nocardia sp. NPDC050712 TaxID=3155518 RepID=UPI0033FB687D
MTSTATQRISRLRTLIEHPRTGPNERAAAQRMLDRILAKTSTAAGPADRVYGERHHRLGKHANLDAIAEMLRDDILVARIVHPHPAGTLSAADPLAEAPALLTIAVETNPGAIDITIADIPRDWGWSGESPSPALQSLAAELADLLNAYNHTGPDLPPRFFGRVRAGEHTLIW